MIEVIYAPRHQFLALLVKGWRLPFVVEPMPGSHGDHSVLMERKETSVKEVKK